jgi:Concanavalin A-like lectin/glucanases superfamily
MPRIGTVLLILLTVMVAVLAVLYYRRHEGFMTENSFLKSQKNLFYRGFNKSLFTNSEIQDDIKNATAALRTSDTFGNNSNAAVDMSSFFEVDPIPGLDKENQELCARVLDPSAMPAHSPGKAKGCGWWYIDDDNKPSVGSLGTRHGPFNKGYLSMINGNGKWIWDLAKAQKMEDMKRCRKVKSCEVADLVPGRCGFCPGLNRGVPINSSKMSIYENDPNLNCGTEVITNPSNCPRPEPIRNEQGEVTNAASLVGICDPNPATGMLTAACLLALATGAGCNESGAIYSILTGDAHGYLAKKGSPAKKFEIITKLIYTNERVKCDLAFFGQGLCSRSEALDFYNKLIQLGLRATNARSREAAKYLTIGSADFDECEQKPDDNGPFELHCLQRVAREAGCQPAGSDYPSRKTKQQYDATNWTGVLNYFKELYANTKSADFEIQAPAVKKCLGITVTPPASDCGDTNGLSTYVYKWAYDWNLPSGSTPKSIYYGRMNSPTFPEINNNGSYTPFNLGTDLIHMRIKANIKSRSRLTTKFWVMTDDGITVNADGKSILQRWYDQGPTAYETTPLTFTENTKKLIMSDWYNNYGGYVAIYRLFLEGSYQPIPASMIEQTQPTGYPIARWDFCEGYVDDRCGTLHSEVVGSVPIGFIDGKKCAMFTGRNHIKIVNGIKSTAFRSITMMLYIRNNTGPYPRPWEFNNNRGGFSGSWCDDSVFGCMSPNNSNGLGFYCKQGCTGPELWTGGNTVSPGKWYHVAWVLDEDLKGMSIYIDGTRAGRYRSESFLLLQNKIYTNMYIFTSVEQFDKDVGVGWFRIFDYSMTTEDINTDRQNGFSTAELYPKSKGTGF